MPFALNCGTKNLFLEGGKAIVLRKLETQSVVYPERKFGERPGDVLPLMS